MTQLKIAILTSDKRDHDRDYGNPVPGFGTAPEALLQGFAQLPEAEAHVVSCTQQPLAAPEKLADNIWYHSLLVPKTGWLRTGYQGCIRAARKKLKEIQPDIVHGQGTERDCAISAVFSGHPNVITIHGNMRAVAKICRAKPFSFLWLAARLENFVLPRTDGVVCITNYTRKAVMNLARRTWVVPNAVNTGFFNVPTSPKSDEPPVGLCIGAICAYKNQNHLIRALAPLAVQKKFKLVFAGQTGGNAYSAEFLQLVKNQPWCEYAGVVAHDQLMDYFKAAAFLVLPSLEDNCPMVVLEAMAAGVPVVAAKIGGVPDLIEEGRTGLFCDPPDSESIRDAVGRLLDEPALGRQLATEAKRRAVERFHPTVVALRHLEIYREILAFH